MNQEIGRGDKMRLNWEQRAKFEQSGLSLNDWKSVNVWKRKCTHPKKYLTRWSKDDISCGICGKKNKTPRLQTRKEILGF